MASEGKLFVQNEFQVQARKDKQQHKIEKRIAKRIKEEKKYKPIVDKLIQKYRRSYTVGEEIFNAISHGLGALLAIAGLVLLIVFAARSGQGIQLAAALVYGISLILEYTASTLYHAIQHPKAKAVFRVLDHSCIYLLIAGSYTPFALITLQEHHGLLIFALVWAIALIGILVESFWREKPKWINVVVYLAMGWIVVWKIAVLWQLLAPVAFWLLLAGGLAYSLGTIFYLLKDIRYMHSIWHIFVLAGSILQYFVVLLFVIG